MHTENYMNWSRVYYLVSDVYKVTRRFQPGEQDVLGHRIRRTAIYLSSAVNTFPVSSRPDAGKEICNILSAISVLESYLQLARKYGLMDDTSGLDHKLGEVREQLCLLGRAMDG